MIELINNITLVLADADLVNRVSARKFGLFKIIDLQLLTIKPLKI